MTLRVKKIAWLISFLISLVIVFTRCERLPAPPAAGQLSISGQVLRSGKGVSGILVTLAGQDSAAVNTDSAGGYDFSKLPSGLYKVQPLSSGFSFTPGSATVELSKLDATGQNFVMSALGPRLVPLRNSLDFGFIFVGSSKSLDLGIGNLGAAALTVSALTFSNPVFRSATKSLSLPPDSLVFASVSFNPTTAGSFNATLTLSSNDSASPKTTISLTGTAIARGQGKIEAAPTSLAFGPIRVANSATARLTLTNSGTDTLHVKSIVSSDSTFTASAASASIPMGRSLELNVTFAPPDTLRRTASLTVTSDASNQTVLNVPMTGSGFTTQASGILASPSTLDFGRAYVDSTSTKALKITNVGRDTLLITAFQFSNGLFSSPFNGDLLAPGASRTYQVSLHSKAVGGIQAVLSIFNSDPLQTRLDIPLTANVTLVPPMSLSLNPASLAFGQVQSSQNKLMWFYIVNPSSVPLVASQIRSSAAVFQPRPDSLQVPPNDSSRVEVVFAPTAVGVVNALVRMKTNVLNRDTVTVAVTGEGTAPPSATIQLSTTSLDFGSVLVNSVSGGGLGITNKGPGDLTVTSITTDRSEFTIQNQNFTLTVGNSTSVQVLFQPRSVGLVRGTLTVSSNDPANPRLTVSLIGAGIDTTSKVALMTLSTRSLDLGQSLIKLSSSAQFQIGNQGKDTLRINSINPTRSEFTAVPNHLDVLPGQNQSVTVSFAPVTAGDVSGTIVLLSNDQLRPIDSIKVHGVGLNADSSVVTSQEVFIPGGVFEMGAVGVAEPVRRITLSSYYMDAYEVTNQDYKAFMDAGGYDNRNLWTADGWQWRETSRELRFDPSNPRPMYWGTGDAPWESDPYSNQPNTPVVGLSWYEAYAYARFRGKNLPSEAQWEYAMRGQTGRVYPWGNEWLGELANHGQSRSPYWDDTDGYKYAAPVGTFPGGKTPEGLYNLAGNVMEWCLDWNGDYDPAQTFNPTGNPNGTERILRGGSWQGSILFARGYHRNRSLPKLRYPDCGIRLVRNF